jgi:hypothetical protein
MSRRVILDLSLGPQVNQATSMPYFRQSIANTCRRARKLGNVDAAHQVLGCDEECLELVKALNCLSGGTDHALQLLTECHQSGALSNVPALTNMNID